MAYLRHHREIKRYTKRDFFQLAAPRGAEAGGFRSLETAENKKGQRERKEEKRAIPDEKG